MIYDAMLAILESFAGRWIWRSELGNGTRRENLAGLNGGLSMVVIHHHSIGDGEALFAGSFIYWLLHLSTCNAVCAHASSFPSHI